MDRAFVDFRLAADDISAIRFGVSPGHELCHAVRVVLRPPEHPLQWGWLRVVRGLVPRESFDLLALVIGVDGYFPDFFTTTPSWDVSPEDEAARLRQVSPALMVADLDKVLNKSAGQHRDVIVRMREHPERARDLIADAWLEVWSALLAPVWDQLERLLRADIAVRARRVACDGVAQMIGGLHEAVQWHGDAVRVALRKHREVLDCRGSGLVLVPSVMSAQCAVLTQPPAQPTVFYPALGVTEEWSRDSTDASNALAALIGPARAQILLAAHEPRTTSQVAADGGLALSTASHHLSVLRNAGLVQSSRDGTRMMHVRSPLGEALLGGKR